ncbi:MAG: hypothetical protein Q9167_001369 [Letrouitia subvulpina]
MALEHASSAEKSSQVRIRLSTSQTDISLPENTGPILVNTSFRRYALSSLVNAILTTENPIPFDFLINGTFLRTSLDDYITRHGLSSETTLHLEYLKAATPPTHVTSFEHDDWVSAIDVLSSSSVATERKPIANLSANLGQQRILSASYDGLLRVWNTSSNILATSPGAEKGGHASPLKAAKFVSPTKIVSSGVDRTIKVWHYTEDPDRPPSSLNLKATLYGHSASVESLAVHPPSNRILSASIDHTVGLWSSQKREAPSAPEHLLPSAVLRGAKRRKRRSSIPMSEYGPLTLLKSHSGPVTGVLFAPGYPSVCYSTSWDHSLKTWDLPTSTLVDTRIASHALFCVTALPEQNLVAVGTSARHIALIDPRTSAATLASIILRGHNSAVVSLAPDPNSSYALVSGSFDGTCRVWDVRSVKAGKDGRIGEHMYTIDRGNSDKQVRKQGEALKVFSVAWDSEVGIVSAGEDKRVHINQGKVSKDENALR